MQSTAQLSTNSECKTIVEEYLKLVISCREISLNRYKGVSDSTERDAPIAISCNIALANQIRRALGSETNAKEAIKTIKILSDNDPKKMLNNMECYCINYLEKHLLGKIGGRFLHEFIPELKKLIQKLRIKLAIVNDDLNEHSSMPRLTP